MNILCIIIIVSLVILGFVSLVEFGCWLSGDHNFEDYERRHHK